MNPMQQRLCGGCVIARRHTVKTLGMLVAMLAGVCCVFLSAATSAGERKADVEFVISQQDEEAIRGLLRDFLKHTRSPKVGFHSSVKPYLDCPAREELLKYGWKAVPYLIEQAARKEAVDALLGSAVIDDKKVTTPEQVFQLNDRRRRHVEETTLPGFVLEILLRQLPSGREGPDRPRQGGITLHDYRESFKWVAWWQANKHRFRFQTENPPTIGPPKDEHPRRRGVRITVHDGLFDVCAVSTKYSQTVREAAAANDVKLVIGEQRYLDIITTVRLKSVTFEEFLYLIGRHAVITGFDYRKTPDGYVIGRVPDEGEKKPKREG